MNLSANMLYDILYEGVIITLLVMVMMIFIEYINLYTEGKILGKLKNSPIKQIVLSSFIGAIPGCGGGFAIVSLYTHKAVGFGALCAAMIASCGDESFMILGTMPYKFIVVVATTISIGILCGLIINYFTKRRGYTIETSEGCTEYTLHSEDHKHSVHSKDNILKEKDLSESIRVDSEQQNENIKDRGSKNFTTKRVLTIAMILTFILLLTINFFSDRDSFILSEEKVNVLFVVIALFTLIKSLYSSDHFIEEHIFDHIIKKHLLPVFCWTTVALALCSLLIYSIDIKQIIESNSTYIPIAIIIAAIIGLIPQSGPHIAFALLVANGTLPLYVLITSMIAQQGHVSLPLLSENKRSWLYSKLICSVAAIIFGLFIYLIDK